MTARPVRHESKIHLESRNASVGNTSPRRVLINFHELKYDEKRTENSVLSKNGEFSVINADVSKSEEGKSGPT